MPIFWAAGYKWVKSNRNPGMLIKHSTVYWTSLQDKVIWPKMSIVLWLNNYGLDSIYFSTKGQWLPKKPQDTPRGIIQ